MKTSTPVREAAVAGQFYPGDAKELSKMVDDLLAQTAPGKDKRIPLALLAPHAGYVFSAPVQAAAYKQIEKANIQTVILIGLSHSYPVRGAAIYPKGSFRTPLGDIPVDEETSQKLLKRCPEIEALEAAHAHEHSVETQLPFLQRTLKNFQIVPLVMGNPDLSIDQKIGDAIAEVVSENEAAGKRTLIVGSTDMAHYPTEKETKLSDEAALKAIEQLDAGLLLSETKRLMSKGIPELHCVLCGEGATIVVMTAAKKLGAKQGTILKHATSADGPYGDSNRTVGYCAVAFYKGNETPEKSGGAAAFSVSEENQKTLLRIARDSIQQFVEKSKEAKSDVSQGNPELSKPAAVFVTLTKSGQLRGCIGITEAELPLSEAVQRYAVAAATEDPRFPKVTKDELASISIEISVLSPIKKVKSADDIVPDRDGVIVSYGFHRGLFLPQVWEHFNGSKENFLSVLCSEKAGLPPNAWKNPNVELSTFTVFPFKEGETKKD